MEGLSLLINNERSRQGSEWPAEKDTDHLMSNLPKVGYIYLTITPADRAMDY